MTDIFEIGAFLIILFMAITFSFKPSILGVISDKNTLVSGNRSIAW